MGAIIPGDILQREVIILALLLAIYNASLTLLSILWSWRISRVIFILKAGKQSHTMANDNRSITLHSFLLKILGKGLDVHIRASIDPAPLPDSQLAFTRCKSVETAPHSLIYLVEKSMNVKAYTLYIFLYIEGAFNKVDPNVKVRASVRRHCGICCTWRYRLHWTGVGILDCLLIPLRPI